MTLRAKILLCAGLNLLLLAIAGVIFFRGALGPGLVGLKFAVYNGDWKNLPDFSKRSHI